MMNNDLSNPQSPDLKNGANNLGKALYSLYISESLDNLSDACPPCFECSPCSCSLVPTVVYLSWLHIM